MSDEAKSDEVLRERIAMLRQRGMVPGESDGWLLHSVLVADFLDVVGDLSLWEVWRLFNLCQADLYVEMLASLPSGARSSRLTPSGKTLGAGDDRVVTDSQRSSDPGVFRRRPLRR